MVVEQVHDPRGHPPKVAGKQLAARPTNLDGKVVYLVPVPYANNLSFMDQLRQVWSERLPTTELRVLPELERGGASPEVRDEIVRSGDAAVVGVGL